MSQSLLRVARSLILLAFASCTAYRSPPPLAPSDSLPHGSVLGTAAIDRSDLPRYLTEEQATEFLTRLRDDLEATQLFDAVVIGPPGDTRATVVYPEYLPRDCFSEPLVTVVTAGVIPYPGCYYSGYRLTLTSDRFESTVVDNRSTPLALLGWVAGPISLLPGWSRAHPVELERQLLRIAISNAMPAARDGEPSDFHASDDRYVRSKSEIPTAVLDRFSSLCGGCALADIGTAFNATDVVAADLPMRRLVAAGASGDRWFMEYDHGGRGLHSHFALFEVRDGTATCAWANGAPPGGCRPREAVRETCAW